MALSPQNVNSPDTISRRLQQTADAHSDRIAVLSKDCNNLFQPTTFRDLWHEIATVAAGLATNSVSRGDHIGLICDTRKEWLVIDQAIIGLGAVDVPRGSESTTEEISYILGHADCRITFVEDATQLSKIITVKQRLPKLHTVIIIDVTELTTDHRSKAQQKDLRVITIDDLCLSEKSKEQITLSFLAAIAIGNPDDIATMIYTSGTTGDPKGVMLTHANFIYQIDAFPDSIPITPDDRLLSVLPVWHAYERILEYYALLKGASIAYSKPLREVMLNDLSAVNPTYFSTVPRIWEAIRDGVYRTAKAQGSVKLSLLKFFVHIAGIHSKLLRILLDRQPRFSNEMRIPNMVATILPLIVLMPFVILGRILVFKKITIRLGTRFKAGISGAGALPKYVDDFFATVGITVLEGYGLTETAPVVSVRQLLRPIINTVGRPLTGTEIKLIKEDGNLASIGEAGLIYVRGPQVMKGYFKRDDDTSAVLSSDGWLDTGDIGTVTITGEIQITGRAKDTIVLLGGENVEPEPIENIVLQSDFIDHVMIVGQDQRFLGALVVPNLEGVSSYSSNHGEQCKSLTDAAQSSLVLDLIKNEINSRIDARTGFKNFERIAQIILLDEPFSVGRQLTHTLKMRRHVITSQYQKRIDSLFDRGARS